MRRAAIILSLLLAVVLAIGIGGIVWLNATDFAGPVARYAARKTGRAVTIASLRVQPGRWVGVQVRDLRLANAPGGSVPEMVTLKHVAAEIDLLSLFPGPMIVRKLDVDGLHAVLERDDRGVGNWTMGDPAAKPAPANPADPSGRARVPTLLDAALHDGEVTYRTGSGAILRMRLASVTVRADGTEQPIGLTWDGAYGDTPVSLRATTASFVELRKPSVPFAIDLKMGAPESGLNFKGTATEPLHLDGLDGALDLDTRKLGEVLAIFQLQSTANLPMWFSGKLLRAGARWRLLDATGALAAAPFSGMLELTEGPRAGPKVAPDHLSMELAFDKLDAGALMARAGPSGGKSRSPDALPTADRDPGVVGEARVSAKRIVYGATEITDAVARGTMMPGKVALNEARFTVAGAKADLSAVMEPASPGTRISATASLEGAEIGLLARMLGMTRPPLDGRLTAHATAVLSGASWPEALKASRAAAVLSMNAGTVSRQLVEMASVDVRALFGGAKGSARITCLLAIADLHGLAGPVAPIRLATSAGTIEGFGEIDLSRKSLDVTIRSEPSTTGAVALDVPIRISGSFDSPSVLPAVGAFDRARLLDASALRQLSPELQKSARASACLR